MDSQQLQAWNAAHPVGMRVLVWPGARQDAPYHTYVRNPAGLFHGTPMVYVKYYGNLALTHVARATGSEAEHDRLHREECVRAAVRWAVPEGEVQACLQRAGEAVLAEMMFFHALSQEEFDKNASSLIQVAMYRHLLEWAESKALAPSLSSLPRPAWTRPAALDHRQRLQLLMGIEEFMALYHELALWLHGNPDKQPYKPEVVLVEKSKDAAGYLWVTLAVENVREAFGLGRNVGLLGQKGGPADG